MLDGRMTDEWERFWEEALMTKTRHMPGGIEQIH